MIYPTSTKASEETRLADFVKHSDFPDIKGWLKDVRTNAGDEYVEYLYPLGDTGLHLTVIFTTYRFATWNAGVRVNIYIQDSYTCVKVRGECWFQKERDMFENKFYGIVSRINKYLLGFSDRLSEASFRLDSYMQEVYND